MNKSRAESFELFFQALNEVDFKKLDLNLLTVIMQAANLLNQYHISDWKLKQVNLDDEEIAEGYDGVKTQCAILDTIMKVIESLQALGMSESNNSK